MMDWYEVELLLIGGLAGVIIVVARRYAVAVCAFGLVVLCLGALAGASGALLVARVAVALGFGIMLTAPWWALVQDKAPGWRDVPNGRKGAAILTIALAGPALVAALVWPIGPVLSSPGGWSGSAIAGQLSDLVFGRGHSELVLWVALVLLGILTMCRRRR